MYRPLNPETRSDCKAEAQTLRAGGQRLCCEGADHTRNGLPCSIRTAMRQGILEKCEILSEEFFQRLPVI